MVLDMGRQSIINSYSVQSGEKMGFQITLLLATFFYVDYFQANMPTFSGMLLDFL